MKTSAYSNFYKSVINKYKSSLRPSTANVFAHRSQHSLNLLQDSKFGEFCAKELPKRAQVVICGGGAVGNSVAYHLARDFDWSDVVLLDQSSLGGLSSKYGAGLLGQIKPTSIETQLCQYSIELYKKLASEGLNTGWKGCGSLSLARTADRMTYFRHIAASAVARNIECHLLTPEEAHERCPIISTEILKGALWIPGDGTGDPYSATLTLAKEAARLGQLRSHFK